MLFRGRERKLAAAIVSLVAAGAALEGTARAAGYVDSRIVADDARVTVDAAGQAKIEHALSLKINAGALRWFDMSGLEAEAQIDPVAIVAATASAGDAPPIAARVESHGDRGVRVFFDDQNKGKGILKGAYVVHVRYAVDLVRARELAIDGAMWRVAWTAPVVGDGYDGARVTLDVPAAPTEPRLASTAVTESGAEVDDGRLATLRRGTDRDELEMVRAHVARGEAVTWAARVDPRAFPAVTDATLRPPPPVPPPPPSRWVSLAELAGLALAALVFGALVARKAGDFAAACARRGVKARALVALPAWARAFGAGVAFAVGIALEVEGLPAWGASAIALAMVLATHRAPNERRAARGPGQWLALAPAEAFDARTRGDALDGSTRAGKWTAALAALGVAALAAALARLDVELAALAVLDALALAPIFATGTASQLPADRVKGAAEALAPAFRALRKDDKLRVAPWARVPSGAEVPDELRVLVVPRASIPGVTGIEIGSAWRATPTGPARTTEVLVRVHDASAAAARMLTVAPTAHATLGRKPEERVLRFVPTWPTKRALLALVHRLADELVDRRAKIARAVPAPTWSGAERRLPPNERVASLRAISTPA